MRKPRFIKLRRSEYVLLIKIANKLWEYDFDNPHLARLRHLSLVHIVSRREETELSRNSWMGKWVTSAELTGRGVNLLAGRIAYSVKPDRPKFEIVDD